MARAPLAGGQAARAPPANGCAGGGAYGGGGCGEGEDRSGAAQKRKADQVSGGMMEPKPKAAAAGKGLAGKGAVAARLPAGEEAGKSATAPAGPKDFTGKGVPSKQGVTPGKAHPGEKAAPVCKGSCGKAAEARGKDRKGRIQSSIFIPSGKPPATKGVTDSSSMGANGKPTQFTAAGGKAAATGGKPAADGGKSFASGMLASAGGTLASASGKPAAAGGKSAAASSKPVAGASVAGGKPPGGVTSGTSPLATRPATRQQAPAVASGKAAAGQVGKGGKPLPVAGGKRDPFEIRDDVKLRKIEALVKQLLDEWSTLSAERQESAFTTIASRFVERVPQDYLALMAEQFAAGLAGDANDGDAEQAEQAVYEEEVEEKAVEAADEWQEEGAEEGAHESGHGEYEAHGRRHGDQTTARLVADKMLGQASRLHPKDWPKVWQAAIRPLGDGWQQEVIVALLQAVLPKEIPDLSARLVAELVRVSAVILKDCEEALQTFASTLEGLVKEHEDAWHVHSYVLVCMFPKTPSTSWGWLRPGWSWTAWWQVTEKVLRCADRYRAFDILVLILQMMQEKSHCVVREQQVWKEVGRMAKVRKALSEWGDMEDSAIIETLNAYGVQIGNQP